MVVSAFYIYWFVYSARIRAIIIITSLHLPTAMKRLLFHSSKHVLERISPSSWCIRVEVIIAMESSLVQSTILGKLRSLPYKDLEAVKLAS